MKHSCDDCDAKDCPVKTGDIEALQKENAEDITLGFITIMCLDMIPEDKATKQDFHAALDILHLTYHQLLKTDMLLRDLKDRYDTLMEAEHVTKTV